MHNLIYLIGRLTKDPEPTKLESGKTVTNITLAVNRNFKNSEGLYGVDYITCTLWNGIATSTCEYTKKGDLVGVKGRIQNNDYTDEESNKKVYSYEIIADKVSFLSSAKKTEENLSEETEEEPIPE